MIYFIDVFNFFLFRINDPVLIFKKRRQEPVVNITIFINRSRKDRSAILLIPNRMVCSTTEKRNTIRCSSDYHVLTNTLKLSERTNQPYPLYRSSSVISRKTMAI